MSQKIVCPVGIAMDDELEKLLMLAESIKVKLEAAPQELLFSPEEMAKIKTKSLQKTEETEEDYKVNLKNVKEEQRIISVIYDIYVTLFYQPDHIKTFRIQSKTEIQKTEPRKDKTVAYKCSD